MEANLRKVRIFFAAPGDLREERTSFPVVVENVQRRVADHRGFHLQPIGWQDTVPGYGRPQELINADVASSDLLVVLFHRRWGTPPGPPGSLYSSGTEGEFEVGLANREKHKSPEIWLFFKHVGDEYLADPGDQLKQVLAFRDRIEQEHKLRYTPFPDSVEWECLFEDFLSLWLNEGGPGQAQPIALRSSNEELQRSRSSLESLEAQLLELRAQSSTQQIRMRSKAFELAVEATQRYLEGRVTVAETRYAQALDSWPDLAEVHNNYAVLLAGLGRSQEAEQHYQQALKLDPDNDESRYMYGRLLAERFRPQPAEEHHRRALKRNRDNPRVHFDYGVLLVAQRMLPEAEEQYRLAIKLDPDYAKAHNNYAVLLADQGRPQEAEQHFQQALKLDPDDAEAHVNYATLLRQQGRLQEADLQYVRALKLDPDLHEAHYEHAMILAKQGRLQEADEHFQRAYELSPGYGWILTDYALQLWDQGRSDKAEELFQQVLREEPHDDDALHNYVILLNQQGRHQRAEECYPQALEFDPFNQFRRSNYSYPFNNGFLMAWELQRALRLYPDDAMAHNCYAVLLADQGRLQEAEQHYQQALKLNPDDAEAHANYAALLKQQERLLKADVHYERALVLGLGREHWLSEDEVHFQYDSFHMDKELQQALKVNPEDAEAHANYAILLTQ
ncbi:MAG: tetratricopeptide repeat protein, partial [Dehalococcoidia bacterium]|nr:tetratricopeptide repeat protein [Dehalococcoidia bacterium]